MCLVTSVSKFVGLICCYDVFLFVLICFCVDASDSGIILATIVNKEFYTYC